jgi:hypothetical protein
MPGVRPSLRAEQADARSRMRALGLSYDEIAAEFSRRYRLRPRAAFRIAYGWTFTQAAGQINAYRAQVGADSAGRASMTGPRLHDYEKWPAPGARKPTPPMLALLARVYNAEVSRLLDLDDYEHYTAADLLLLDTMITPGKRDRAAPTAGWVAGRSPHAVLDGGSPVDSWTGAIARRGAGPELGFSPLSGPAQQERPRHLTDLPPGEPPTPSDLFDGESDRAILTLPGGRHQMSADAGEVFVAIDRRVFLTGAGVVVPAAGLELSRQDLSRAVTADREMADVADWQYIAADYGHSYLTAPPAALMRGLQVDLSALGDAARRQRTEPARNELRKVAALLAAVTAQTVANLGDVRSSRRWWRTAKQAADESGDLQTRLWIRGKEIVQALYEPRSLTVVLDLVADAEDLVSRPGTPPAALPQLLSGKAQALALTGKAAPAETVLRELRDTVERLPAQTTRDIESLFGWSEHNMYFTESYVYSHLGNYPRAEAAQTAALPFYPATNLRGPASIELQRALCLVRIGDITPGVKHAHTVLTALPREQYNRPMIDLGQKVLAAMPATEHDSAQTLRAHLASHGTA